MTTENEILWATEEEAHEHLASETHPGPVPSIDYMRPVVAAFWKMRTKPHPEKPGVRVDIDGNEWYSAEWRDEIVTD